MYIASTLGTDVDTCTLLRLIDFTIWNCLFSIIVKDTGKSITTLDMVPPYETHKVGVIYVKPGQVRCDINYPVIT